MSEDPRCQNPRYRPCPAMATTVMVGHSQEYVHTITSDRNVSFTAGSLGFIMQTRKRGFNFHFDLEHEESFIRLITDSPLMDAVGCEYTSSGSSDIGFHEDYETIDTELCFLDLRNDTAVTKEIRNTVKTEGLQNDAPTDRLNVFTGFETELFFPFIYNEGIPITEDITYSLYIGGSKTELNTESVARGYPFSYILMPTFPVSRLYNIHFNEEWAEDTDWYRQDLRREEDGDALLFWPEWCRSAGKMSQLLDTFNRDTLLRLNFIDEADLPLTGDGPGVEVPTNKIFKGSVAFDVEGNTFYSIATPNNEYAVPPEHTVRNKLLVSASNTEIPVEQIYEEDGFGGYTKKDSEHTCYYPIAPL